MEGTAAMADPPGLVDREEPHCARRTVQVWFSPGRPARHAKTARLRLVNEIRPELTTEAHEQGLERELGVQVELLQLAPHLAHYLAGSLRARDPLERRVLPECGDPIRVNRGGCGTGRDDDEVAVPGRELFERGQEL